MTKFTYRTKESLFVAAESAKVILPWSDNLEILRKEKRIGGSNVVMRNRLTIHPMEGFDSTPDGSPSELTMRRGQRFADGGAGLIWLEATAVTEDGRTNTGQLWINETNADAFARMAEMMHERSGGVPLILQLTHSGLSMTACLFADRLAEYGINVYEVRPGIIATDMTAGVREKYDRLIAEGLCPIGRIGQPEDVGRTVQALCDGFLSYSTGEIINVDGGMMIQKL